MSQNLEARVRQLEAENSRLRAEIAASRVSAADVLEAAHRLIERRRTARRLRWIRRPRWSAREESVWSQGMWDAGAIVFRYARDLRRQAGTRA